MGLITNCIPLEGLRDNMILGSCLYLGDNCRENLFSMRLSTILYSIIVRFLPTQILPPNPKGKNPIRCLHPPPAQALNRSGLNSFTSSPHSDASWCNPTTSTHMLVPFGMTSDSPIAMSSRACRCTFGAGEYSLSTSLRTQLICMVAWRIVIKMNWRSQK